MIIKLLLRALAVALVAILVFAGLMSATGCNSEKKALRKDNVALERVKASRKLLDNLAPVINDLYPQSTDTVIVEGKPILIKGKDSTYAVYFNVPVYSTKIKIIDTLIKGVYIKIDTLGRVTIKLPTPDTSIKPKTIQLPPDLRGKAIDAKTIETQGLTIAALNQNIIDLNAVIKSKSSKTTWLVIVCILAGIVILGLLYLVFKPSIK